MVQIIKNTELQLFKNSKPDGIWFVSWSFYTEDEEFVQTIIDWLSEACIDNFIVVRRVEDIVAGGYGSNIQAFRLGKFNLKKIKLGRKKTFRRIGPRWTIHLTKSDNFSFYLRWVDEVA